MFNHQRLSPDGVNGGGALSVPTRPEEAETVRGRELANAEQRKLGQRMLFALVDDQGRYAEACKEQFDKGKAHLNSVIGKHRSDANDSKAYDNYVRNFGSAGTPLTPNEFREKELGMAIELEKLIEKHLAHPPKMPIDRANLASNGPKTHCFIPMSNQGGGFSILHIISKPIQSPADLVNYLAQSVLSDIDNQRRAGRRIDLNNFPQYQALLGISEAVRQHSINLAIEGRDSKQFMQTTLSKIAEAASSRTASGAK